MNLFERIEFLCQKKGITVNKLQTDLNMGNYVIYKWDGRTNPRIDTLIQVADYFGVSLDYLAGKSDYQTIQPPEYQESTYEIADIIEDIHLKPREAKLVVDFLKALKDYCDE